MICACDEAIIGRLPPVRGRLGANAPLDKLTWFRVGGPADILFRPADAADLADFLERLARATPVTVIGVGSNLILRDGGLAGVTIRLGRGLAGVAVEGEEIRAGAGALGPEVARAAAAAGVEGLEFLCGIPGSIGGALRMNAGAYGSEIKDRLVAATALDREGRRQHLTAADMGLSYRHSSVDPRWIFVAARFRGRAGGRAEIDARMAEIKRAREATQPIRTRTGGSTFLNPPGDSAWRLIDAAGCRGLALGGAMVSEKHANFLINTGRATAGELEALGDAVRRRVHAAFGIWLEWEIQRLGRPLPGAFAGLGERA
jgi:UDP-N-acetylmuramate dehydrogenase